MPTNTPSASGDVTAEEIVDGLRNGHQYMGQICRAAAALIEHLSTPPPGYPECTSAVLDAMNQEHGVNIVRMMHANQKLIEQQQRQIERYEEALNKYGNSDNWRFMGQGASLRVWHKNEHGYELAQQALKGE